MSEVICRADLCSDEEIDWLIIVNAIKGVAHDANVAFDIEGKTVGDSVVCDDAEATGDGGLAANACYDGYCLFWRDGYSVSHFE